MTGSKPNVVQNNTAPTAQVPVQVMYQQSVPPPAVVFTHNPYTYEGYEPPCGNNQMMMAPLDEPFTVTTKPRPHHNQLPMNTYVPQQLQSQSLGYPPHLPRPQPPVFAQQQQYSQYQYPTPNQPFVDHAHFCPHAPLRLTSMPKTAMMPMRSTPPPPVTRAAPPAKKAQVVSQGQEPEIYLVKGEKCDQKVPVEISEAEIAAKLAILRAPTSDVVKMQYELKFGQVDYPINDRRDEAYLACVFDHLLHRIDETVHVIAVGDQNSYLEVKSKVNTTEPRRQQFWLVTVWVNKRKDSAEDRAACHNLLSNRNAITDLYICIPNPQRQPKAVRLVMPACEAAKIVENRFNPLDHSPQFLECIMDSLPKKRYLQEMAVAALRSTGCGWCMWPEKLKQYKFPAELLE